MSQNEGSELGKALLAIGGVILGGKIISSLLEEDEPTREVRSSKKKSKPDLKLKSPSQFLKEINEGDQKQRVIVEIDSRKGTSRSGDSLNPDPKYPPFYYTFSKSQQYKYRQKLRKDKRISEL